MKSLSFVHLLTSLPSMSLHFVPSRAACMAFVNKAVNIDNMSAPTKIHTTPNKRPRDDFGVLSPYLVRLKHVLSSTKHQINLWFQNWQNCSHFRVLILVTHLRPLSIFQNWPASPLVLNVNGPFLRDFPTNPP